METNYVEMYLVSCIPFELRKKKGLYQDITEIYFSNKHKRLIGAVLSIVVTTSIAGFLRGYDDIK